MLIYIYIFKQSISQNLYSNLSLMHNIKSSQVNGLQTYNYHQRIRKIMFTISKQKTLVIPNYSQLSPRIVITICLNIVHLPSLRHLQEG